MLRDSCSQRTNSLHLLCYTTKSTIAELKQRMLGVKTPQKAPQATRQAYSKAKALRNPYVHGLHFHTQMPPLITAPVCRVFEPVSSTTGSPAFCNLWTDIGGGERYARVTENTLLKTENTLLKKGQVPDCLKKLIFAQTLNGPDLRGARTQLGSIIDAPNRKEIYTYTHLCTRLNNSHQSTSPLNSRLWYLLS